MFSLCPIMSFSLVSTGKKEILIVENRGKTRKSGAAGRMILLSRAYKAII